MFPGLAIVSLVTGISLLGEGINDILNPRLRAAGMSPEGLIPGIDAEADADPPPPAAHSVTGTDGGRTSDRHNPQSRTPEGSYPDHPSGRRRTTRCPASR